MPEAKSWLLAQLTPGGRPIWILLAAVNIVTLYFQWKAGVWLFRADWSIYPHDYIAQWAAGMRVNNGQAALVYNWAEQVALQTKLIGATKPADFYVFYPPHFLFTTPVFTALKPVPAYVAFLITTIALYAVILNLVVRDWLKAIPAALAGGGAYFCMLWVQNGFLMGALLLGALVVLPHKPRMAGVLLGILTIKPQLGLLVPLALAAGGQWRTFVWAAGTFLILALSAELILGPGIWATFMRSMSDTVGFLEAGTLWFKMQTPFALALPLLGERGAYLVQGLVAVGVAVIVVSLWRDRQVPYDLKAAGLIAGTMLVSPYLYPYDAVVLTGAALLLLRTNPRLPWPDRVAILAVILMPGLARVLFSAALPIASCIMLVLVLRQARRSADEIGSQNADLSSPART